MKHIKGFDGLRAISILFVIASHIWLPEALPEASFFKVNYLLIAGVTGVMIFFTLSGFLITLLLLQEQAAKGRIELRKFFARRFLRLLPPLVIFYFLIAVLMLTKQLANNPAALLISFFYLGNFIPKKYWAGELFHTWSLGVEEQFYLLWPFIVKRFSAWAPILRTALLLILVSLLFIKVLPSLTVQYKGKEGLLGDYFYTDCWFIPACLPIMLGALGGAAVFYKKDFFYNTLRRSHILLLFGFLLYCCPVYMPHTMSAGYVLAIQSFGISLFLIWIYFNQQSVLVRLLEFGPIRFLGLISYGVYVYQGLFLRTGPGGGTLAVQKYPLNICLTFCAAILSYYTIEKWARKQKMRFR